MGAINATCLPACVPREAEHCDCPGASADRNSTRSLRSSGASTPGSANANGNGRNGDGASNPSSHISTRTPGGPSPMYLRDSLRGSNYQIHGNYNPAGYPPSCGPFQCGAFRDPTDRTFKTYASAREARREANKLWKRWRMDAAYDAFSQALNLVERALAAVQGSSAGRSNISVSPGGTISGGGVEQSSPDDDSTDIARDVFFQASLFDEVADFLFENHNNPDVALALYDKAALLEPEKPERWYKKGVALQMQNKYDLARQNFEKAIALSSSGSSTSTTTRTTSAHKPSRFNLGVVYFNLMRYVEALEVFQSLLRDEEEEAKTARGDESGSAAAGANNTTTGADTGGSSSVRGGITALGAAASAGPRPSSPNVDSRVNLLILIADCHEKLENPKLACEFLEKAVALDPGGENRTAEKQLEDLLFRYQGGVGVGGLDGVRGPRGRGGVGAFQRSGRVRSSAGHVLVDAETVTVGCY